MSIATIIGVSIPIDGNSLSLISGAGRLSHSPKSPEELRKEMSIQEQKDFIFRVAHGQVHKSILEHLVFNIDFRCSRLAVEFYEGHRLASYTERSQRFVKKGFDEFFIPENSTEIGDECSRFFYECYDLYEQLKESGMKAEDARCVLPLSTLTDFCMTVNARELEYILSYPYLDGGNPEIQDLNYQLRQQLWEIFDSDIFKYDVPHRNLNTHGIAFSDDNGVPLDVLLTGNDFHIKPYGLTNDERRWELLNFVFQFSVSSSCYAQLKRHRMCTLIPFDYKPLLHRFPKAFADKMDLVKPLLDKQKELCLKYADKSLSVGSYLLLNANIRAVYFGVNIREFKKAYKLRTSEHAQQEIKDKFIWMYDVICEVPNFGKDIKEYIDGE